MIKIDYFIINIIQSEKYKKKNYPSYFAPEIAGDDKNQVSDELFNKDPELFEEYRKNGENTDEIAVLIRKDLIDEFITYVSQKEYPLNSKIEDSLFETNSYLLKKGATLIQYAAFYGSIQIFKYLQKNGAKLSPSIWFYAIHGDSAEIISILNENQIKPIDETYCQCFYESVKCHHNEMAVYIMKNFITNKSELNNNELFFKYYNLKYIECNEIETKSLFFIAIKYEYAYLVKIILETTDIDANSTTETFSDCKPAFDLKSLMRPDYKIKEIKTPLVIAAEKGSIEVAKLLLANENIDVNKAEQCYSQETQMHNRDGKYPLFYSCNSPLTIAIEKGYIEIAKLLLSHPQIDVNFNHKIEDNDNDNIDVKSALILAIENEELDIVKLLLANPKIDVNARSIKKKAYEKDYDEKTPLYFAIQKGNIEIIKEILKSNDFDVNSSQLIKVSYPYEEGNDPTTKTLISALNLATEQSNLDIVNLLLSHPKISLNEQSTKCLKYMSKMSSFVEYKMGGGWSYIMPLINKVMNNPGNDFKLLETVNYPALCFAISHKEFDIAKAILSSEQCDVNADMTRSSHAIEEKEWSALAETKIPALCFAIDSNNS
ncbi:hypothetical protein M9Y10_004397 [Tritrichomonas musculus]|uniref:DUF3447 domain-containing protein n=1 Tax=Tritrichomonas musculus TaxID=1915356 RepID=A0ABR2JSQ5_9EUKA